MKEKINNYFKEKITRFSWPRVLFVFGIILVISACLIGGLSVYGYTYQNKVLPNTKLGQFSVGGMNRAELGQFLEKISDKMVGEGWHFVYDKNEKKEILVIYPISGAEGDALELISFDFKKEVERLIDFNKTNSLAGNGFKAVLAWLGNSKTGIENLQIDNYALRKILTERLSEGELPPQNANIKILSVEPLNYVITTANSGNSFGYDKLLAEVDYNSRMLLSNDILAEKKYFEPTVQEKDVASIVDKLPKILGAGGLQLVYHDPENKREYEWQITVTQLVDWLEIKKNYPSGFYFGLNQDLVVKYLEDIVAAQINVPARDAKFKTDADGKVIEFQGSRPGIELSIFTNGAEVDTFGLLEKAFLERTEHESGFTKVITLVVKRVEPKIKTGDVNGLGISEVLGVGISDYSNSPTNRIKNIKNAVNKLNGVLIKPGEEFSTLKYTAPFTLEGGYYPELVIKGDEIKPEIGGGLCQIGTTLFRMAMNSAMLVTNRRNHSLVISHYNDPVNNLPGTDATVYDPAPDFKFLNDTDNYILIQTAMDTKTQELIFTLWGASDGRSGSYTHPVVLKWLPVGETKNIETTKLAPGKIECQNAFKGADASFTYTRVLANGQKEETLFESHYRPLPKICLVGVAEVVPVVDSTSSTIAVDITAVE
ncbi:MAG: VanW family protein [Candidatus Magasanikbacteria bacterium GW2011_GWC2_37_14]|uniref:VanW family protein n=1 Tax=Candidatus Magasanikbacteria bacterium GW2011_GWC2_37_14 TaxID=1619046 RepID=A0A0G0JHQ2_9BACT|nr:MAG: VanW family protein [Candidatus Magasanikbacteria bacterium GW2011_GWC2_37_14]